MLQKTLEAKGLAFKLKTQTAEIVGSEDAGKAGRVTAVRFKDGAEVPADLVVMAVGIRPNFDLAAAAGLSPTMKSAHFSSTASHVARDCTSFSTAVITVVAAIFAINTRISVFLFVNALPPSGAPSSAPLQTRNTPTQRAKCS